MALCIETYRTNHIDSIRWIMLNEDGFRFAEPILLALNQDQKTADNREESIYTLRPWWRYESPGYTVRLTEPALLDAPFIIVLKDTSAENQYQKN